MHFLRSPGGLIAAVAVLIALGLSIAFGVQTHTVRPVASPSATPYTSLTSQPTPPPPGSASPSPSATAPAKHPSPPPSTPLMRKVIATPDASSIPTVHGSPHPAGGSPAPSATPFVPSAADLQAALLTSGELPDGSYTVQPSDSAIGFGTLTSVASCPQLTEGQSDLSAEQAVAYTAGQLGPDLSETLLQNSVSGARTQLAGFGQVARACGHFALTADGLKMDITLATEPFPVSGDQTVALRITVVVLEYGVTINGDMVAVRHEGTVIVLTNVGYPLNSGLTESLTARAYAKVAARW